MPFRYLEDISFADVAFEASGSTLEEVFRDAANAAFEVMVYTRTVKPILIKEIVIENEDLTGYLSTGSLSLYSLKIRNLSFLASLT